MLKILSIGLGGFTGAILRYWISGWVYTWVKTDFPSGTLVVNVVGSFLLGVVMGITEHYVMNPNLRLFITIGVLGAFTTFSTFSYETLMLFQVGAYGKAFLNMLLSVFVGVSAAFAGLMVGRIM